MNLGAWLVSEWNSTWGEKQLFLHPFNFSSPTARNAHNAPRINRHWRCNAFSPLQEKISEYSTVVVLELTLPLTVGILLVIVSAQEKRSLNAAVNNITILYRKDWTLKQIFNSNQSPSIQNSALSKPEVHENLVFKVNCLHFALV